MNSGHSISIDHPYTTIEQTASCTTDDSEIASDEIAEFAGASSKLL